MSDVISKIKSRLDADHPTVFVTEDGEQRVLSAEQRDAIIAEWAASMVVVAMERIRQQRNSLLVASDWTQIPDAPVDSAAWAKYRQALRDLPAKIKDPTAEVAWPEPPK